MREDAKNPITAEPVTTLGSEAEWEREYTRRVARVTFEWRCFDAWWEAYKLAMSCAPKAVVQLAEVADNVEREYRTRRIDLHDTVERIWVDFPDRPRSVRPVPGGGS